MPKKRSEFTHGTLEELRNRGTVSEDGVRELSRVIPVEIGLPGPFVASSCWLLPGLLKTEDRGFLSRGVASELSLSLEVPGAPEGGGKESYREQSIK